MARINTSLASAQPLSAIVEGELESAGMAKREARESRGMELHQYDHDLMLMKLKARSLSLCTPRTTARDAGDFATDSMAAWAPQWPAAWAHGAARLDEHCTLAARDMDPCSGRPGRQGAQLKAFNPFSSSSSGSGDNSSSEESSDPELSSDESSDGSQ